MHSKSPQVCIRKNYCEWCFKGSLGASNGEWVPVDSHRIDKVQSQHTKHNGLLVLDMENPGAECENRQNCGIVCLVCGEKIISGPDPRFETLKDLICTHRTDSLEFQNEVVAGQLPFLTAQLEKNLKNKIHRSLEKYRSVWVDQWKRPIHLGCAKKTACNCVVPVGETVCPRHNKPLRVERNQKSTHMDRPKKSRPEQTETHNKLVTRVLPQECYDRPLQEIVLPEQIGTSEPEVQRVLPRATWLNPLSRTAMCVGGGNPSSTETKKMGEKTIIPSTKRKPLAPKKQAQKVKSAAEGCSFKIESWAIPCNSLESQVAQQEIKTHKNEKKDGRFTLDLHNQKFDPMVHGYVWGKDGRLWYIRGDGVRVKADCEVNELTADGDLVPLC
jgi:hypothetical protein